MQLKDDVFIKKWNAFQMLIWLCAYYNFFCIRKVNAIHACEYTDTCLILFFIAVLTILQNHSKFVADAIGSNLQGLLDDQVIYLLQSFIYPKEMMIKRVETPPLLDENAQRFTLAKDLQVVQQGVGNPRDPIFELFNPFKEGTNESFKTMSPQITCIPSFQYLQIKVILDCAMPWPTWWLQSLHVLLSPTTCGTTCLRQMN